MKRFGLIAVLVLLNGLFLCTEVLADKKSRAPNKVLQPKHSTYSGDRWAFESRFVTMPNAAEVRRDRLAAETGDAEAQFRMAQRYEGGFGVPKDYTESVNWLRKSAEQDFPDAQFNLGSMYFEGFGVQEDPKMAVDWFQKAANQGHASAQKNLGAMYGMGQGVEQDHSEAYVWSVMAILSGNESAANNRDAAASQLSPEQLDAANKRLAMLHAEMQQ
jgi:TPR repeat protein